MAYTPYKNALSYPPDMDADFVKLLKTYAVGERFTAKSAAEKLGMNYTKVKYFLPQVQRALESCDDGVQLVAKPQFGYMFIN